MKNDAREVAYPLVVRKILRVSSKTKLLNKLANFASDKNWTLDEAELVLTHCGFTKRDTGSSHRVFSHHALDQPLVLAAHGKSIKSGYIRLIRQAVADLPK